MNLRPGHRLGRYEILGPIGAGGMGEVWRARDTELDREVAVKVLPSEVAESPERRKRFEREARATASLNHPNLLTVHDVGIDRDQPYIVTELLEGETLRQVLRHGPPPPASAVVWSLGISRGLAAAHSRSIVHRDVKPDNVFLTTDNRVKILDFGLAKILETDMATGEDDETAALSSDTAAGTLLGTMGYMAPEQLRGDPVDVRTDVFAFGCVLYEMLSGRRPFAGGSSAEHVSAVLRDEPPPLADTIPLALRAVVRRCLEKKPAARYQSAGEVAAALEAIDPSSLGHTPGERPSISIRAASSSAEPAVAVMPFANMSGDPEQEYFCDGMAEEILGAIGKVRGLKVLARSSSFAFKGQKTDPRKVGNTIGADHLLEGSIQRAGDRIRISARLVQARDGTQLWADRYDRTISDIFELQDEISAEVANQLRTTLMPDEIGELQRSHVPDREAYDLYIRGRHLWYRRGEGDMMEAVRLYEQAIEIDPEYAEPHVGIAQVFMVLGTWGVIPTGPAIDRTRQETAIALGLDDRLAGAHATLGFLATFHEYELDSENHFRKAIELDPSSGMHKVWLSHLYALRGRWDDARAEAEKAVEAEPLSPVIHCLAAQTLSSFDLDAAMPHYRQAVEMEPDNPVNSCCFGLALGGLAGRYEDAIAELNRSAPRWPLSMGGLSCFHAMIGDRDAAEGVAARIDELSRTHHVSPGIHAWVAAGRRDTEATLDAIEASAYAGEWMGLLFHMYKPFDFVADHPRSMKLRKRLRVEHLSRPRNRTDGGPIR